MVVENDVHKVLPTHVQDVYVAYDLSKETLEFTPHIRVFETNEYMHSGLRDDS